VKQQHVLSQAAQQTKFYFENGLSFAESESAEICQIAAVKSCLNANEIAAGLYFSWTFNVNWTFFKLDP
jgi:hypothetical protein